MTIDNIIRRFAAYLTLERGMSENTRLAYRADVEKLVDAMDIKTDEDLRLLDADALRTVSYTHLTLPTILLV